MSARLPLLVAVLVATFATAAGVQAVGRPALNPTMWVDAPGYESGSAVENGFAIQQRGYFSITAHFQTNGLTAGHRYTNWWVIYNNPSGCSGECDIEDLITALGTGQNPARIGVLYGGTFVAPTNGKYNGTAQILENWAAGCQNVRPISILCNPLADVTVGEASVLINDQGPASAFTLGFGKDMFANGCSAYVHNGEVVLDFGKSGFDCYTAQTVHLP